MDARAAVRLFDDNAPTYDRVNSAVSLGLDASWRGWVAEQAVVRPGARVLDAFAGTGLAGIAAGERGAVVTLADASPGMLEQARRHAEERGIAVRTVLTDLAAERTPFAPASFDAVTVCFGVRYLDEPAAVLRRLGTLLAPGGRLVVLEFVCPRPGVVSTPASWYFFRVLPRIASRLAGRADLYAFLAQSVDRVGHARDLARVLESAGFSVTGQRIMGFGLVAGLVCSPARE